MAGTTFWGQQVALELSNKLNTNPDTARGDGGPYSRAKNLRTVVYFVSDCIDLLLCGLSPYNFY